MPRMARLGLLGLLAVVALAEEPTAPVGGTGGLAHSGADDPWVVADVAPEMGARPLARGTEKTSAQLSVGSPNPPAGSWVRTSIALGGVIGLILLLGWGYRVVASRNGGLPFGFRGRAAQLIEIVARTSLSPRQSLALVRIGPRLVLLGLSPDAVRTLDVISDAELTARLVGLATQGRPDSSTAEFAGALESETRAYEPPSEVSEEEITPEEQRIVAVRQSLAGTLQRLRAKTLGA